MSKIKLVVEVSEEIFKVFEEHSIVAFDFLDEYTRDMLAQAIANGTPITEGDLISKGNEDKNGR